MVLGWTRGVLSRAALGWTRGVFSTAAARGLGGLAAYLVGRRRVVGWTRGVL